MTRREHMDKHQLDMWFKQYHAANPHIYRAFRKMAYELRHQGHKRYGAKTIMERLRWESAVRHPGEVFKMSNNIKDRCSARYARMLIAEDLDFIEFFTLKPLLNYFKRQKLSEAHSMQIKLSGPNASGTDWGLL